MSTLFISDLHLEAARPEIAAQLFDFLGTEAASADALYILGDLFESWVGDDDPNEHYATVKNALRDLADTGVPLFFMHGNRDFMIGDRFAEETGVSILPDPYVTNIHGRKVMLSHGDAYCTDDLEYQAVRKMSRDPAWQSMMLAKSLDERLAFAAQARAASMAHGGSLNDDISDVNDAAIHDAMSAANVRLMLHGHTHRPAVHDIEVDGDAAQRIVLGDWYEQGSVVRWDDSGPRLGFMPRS